MAPHREDLASNKRTETDKKEYGFGIHPLDDLRERDLYILLTCPQESLQPRDELVVDPLRLSALFVGLLRRDAHALRGPMIAVPLERVAARKEVPAVVAEEYLQRVRLRCVAVPLEVLPRLERCVGVGTAPALDFANRATCPVGLRGREQRFVPRLELSRELEVLVLRFLLLLLLLLLLRRHLLHTPLNPNQLS
ncbi:hypothetical protein DFH94DRAFT_785332, partial [Russula ochroleuca]